MAGGNEVKYDFMIIYDNTNTERDETYAVQIAEKLESSGKLKGYIACRDEPIGQSAFRNVEHALSNSRFIFLLVSNTSLTDGFWDLTTSMALLNQIQTNTEVVVPIYLPDLDVKKIPLRFDIYQGVSYEEDPEASFWKLLFNLFR